MSYWMAGEQAEGGDELIAGRCEEPGDEPHPRQHTDTNREVLDTQGRGKQKKH